MVSFARIVASPVDLRPISSLRPAVWPKADMPKNAIDDAIGRARVVRFRFFRSWAKPFVSAITQPILIGHPPSL